MTHGRQQVTATRMLGLATLAALGSSACFGAAGPTPRRFSVSGAVRDPVSVAVRTLAEAGLEAASVDRASGVVATGWEDTQFRYGTIHGMPAYVMRRFVVVIQAEEGSVRITVRMDQRACASGAFVPAGSGPCRPVDALYWGWHQEEVDQLARDLREALPPSRAITESPRVGPATEAAPASLPEPQARTDVPAPW